MNANPEPISSDQDVDETVGCIPCALPRPLLLALMRTVAKSPVWRENRADLARHTADDVWQDQELWFLSFELKGPAERVLVFSVELQPGPTPGSVRTARLIEREIGSEWVMIAPA